MVERAADYAGTHGSHTAELPSELTERTAHLRRLLETTAQAGTWSGAPTTT